MATKLAPVRPNVLWVLLDAARRDALEPYGAAPGATPVMADVASRGAALPEVFATACWTVPSHASLFTGLLPRAAGLSRAPGGTRRGCADVLQAHGARVLPEVLRRAGYRTGAVSANLWVSEASGFTAGFDAFASVDSGRQGQLHGSSWRSRARWALEGARAQVDDGAGRVEEIIRQWLDRGPSRPFFWFVNLVECHSPYLPPRPYNDLRPAERLQAAREARRHLNLDAIWRACVGGFDIPEDALARMRHLYGRCISYLDDWLGRVLSAFEDRSLLDDTLIVICSDHGENLGEGGLIAHALSLDNRLLHVPFLVAGPGADAAADMRSLAEVPRFIAEAVGLSGDPWRGEGPPPGVGIAQHDPPVSPADPRAREAIDRWGLGEEALVRLTQPLTCATDGRLKVVETGEARLVYDLTADPLELQPEVLDGPGSRHGDRLSALLAALRHPAVTARRDAEPPGSRSAEGSVEELREIEDRMRLLGYL